MVETDHPVISEAVELSLNSMVEISTTRTMKLRGVIRAQEVVVLIDCGASYNLISIDLVENLGIPCVGAHGFGVLMGIGLSDKGEVICKGVVLRLQNIDVVEDFL